MINFEAIMAQFADDKELVVNIINIFQDSYPQMRQDVDDAIAAGDAGKLEISAHTLKGAQSYFHYDDLTDRLLVLEKKGSNNDLDNAGPLFEEAKVKLDKLLEELEDLKNNQLAG